MELDRALLGAIEFQERARPVGRIERQVAVRDVRQHEQFVRAREAEQLGVELGGLDRRGRVVGEVDRDRLGPARLRGRDRRQVCERDLDHSDLGDRSLADIGGVAGGTEQQGVAGIEMGEQELGDPFLRAHARGGLGGGVYGDSETPLVPLSDGAPELGQTVERRVAVILNRGVVQRGLQGLDGPWGGSEVRISDPQVDHIYALPHLFVAVLKHLGERVGGQSLVALRGLKHRFDRRLAGRHSLRFSGLHGGGTGLATFTIRESVKPS